LRFRDLAKNGDDCGSPEGPVLTIADKDGDRKITIGPDTAIWIARAARITDIKVGSAVTMTGVKREDGSLQALRATIGPTGAGKPACGGAGLFMPHGHRHRMRREPLHADANDTSGRRTQDSRPG